MRMKSKWYTIKEKIGKNDEIKVVARDITIKTKGGMTAKLALAVRPYITFPFRVLHIEVNKGNVIYRCVTRA